MRDLLLTLDAGTTALKATVFDREGHALHAAVSAYGVEMPKPGWAQQPAPWFVGAAIRGTRALLTSVPAARIAAIGLSGTMNGCIPVSGVGEALYPNIIHSDVRAEGQLPKIARVLGPADYYARCGNRLDMHYMLPKMLWLKENHPDVFRSACWFVNTKDILYGFLTGRHGKTDFSDASLTGALNLHEKAWDEDLLGALGIRPEVMPEILCAHDVSGTLTREAAAALGLAEGLPVAMGAGDGLCATHGAGLFEPGSAYVNLGSSAWLATLSDAPVIDPKMRVFNFLDMDGKRSVVCATVQCAGAAVDWALENLILPGQKPDDEAFSLLEALAGESCPGAEGVFFLPTLMGERTPWWDASARGTLIGATLYHGRPHIARAVYEGVAQALRLCDEVLSECGLSYRALALIGGGAGSRIWPQMMADMFQMPTRVHAKARQATSLGAAMAAGVGIGLFADYADAGRMARFAGDYAPDPLRAEAYRAHFDVYRQLYAHMAGAYRLIGAYQAG